MDKRPTSVSGSTMNPSTRSLVSWASSFCRMRTVAAGSGLGDISVRLML